MNNPIMLTETREGAVLVLTMNYPERRNALAMPMRQAMIAALDRIEADPEVRAVVLTGVGGIFSSGGDISAMAVRDIAAGRERFRLDEIIRRLLNARGDSREVIAHPQARLLGIAPNERALLPENDAHLGRTGFDAWLSAEP